MPLPAIIYFSVVSCFANEVSTGSDSDRVKPMAIIAIAGIVTPVATAPGTDAVNVRRRERNSTPRTEQHAENFFDLRLSGTPTLRSSNRHRDHLCRKQPLDWPDVGDRK